MNRLPGCEIGPTLAWKRDVAKVVAPALSQHRSTDGQWVMRKFTGLRLGTPWQLFRKDAVHPTLHLLGSFKTAKEAKSAAQGTLDIEARAHARNERAWKAKRVMAATGFSREQIDELGGIS